MAIIGQFGGADDVRLSQVRYDAKLAGGVQGSGGMTIQEMYMDALEFSVAGGIYTIANAFDAPGSTILTGTGGDLTDVVYRFFIEGVEATVVKDEALSVGKSQGFTLTPVATAGKAVSCVREGASSVTGLPLLGTANGVLIT